MIYYVETPQGLRNYFQLERHSFWRTAEGAKELLSENTRLVPLVEKDQRPKYFPSARMLFLDWRNATLPRLQ
jgi:hypothetical protein